jgi:hypothetical protein
MYSCVRGIDFASFYEFSIGFLKTFLLDFYNFFLFDFLIVPTLWYFFLFFIFLQFVNLQMMDVLGYYYHVRLNVMTLRQWYKYLPFNKYKNVCYINFKHTMSDLFLFHSHRQIFIEIFHLQIMKCWYVDWN